MQIFIFLSVNKIHSFQVSETVKNILPPSVVHAELWLFPSSSVKSPKAGAYIILSLHTEICKDISSAWLPAASICISLPEGFP